MSHNAAKTVSHPNPLATHPYAPLWVASGRYGYTMVDQYRPNLPGNGVYGTSLGPMSRKVAEQVASALNTAFDLGLTQGAMGGQS
jgi:hypothetical protein